MNEGKSLPVDSPGAIRAARGSLASLARGLVTVPLNLILVALILQRLGPSALGVWGLLGLLTNPVLTYSFGLATALTRQVALDRDDAARHARLLSAGLFAYGILALVLILADLALNETLVTWIQQRPDQPAGQLTGVGHLALASYLVLLVGYPFSCVLYGREDVARAQSCITANQILMIGLAYFVVSPESGLMSLYACTLAGMILQTAGAAWFATRALGISPLRAFERRELVDLLRESVPLAFLECFRVGFYYLDKWLLTAAMGTAATGFYELGARLGLVFRALLNTFSVPLLAGSAGTLASDRTGAKLERLTYYSLRYLLAMALPIGVFTALEAPRILMAWVGTGEPLARFALQLMIPSYLLNALGWGVLWIVIGQGRVLWATTFGLFALALNAVADLVALHQFGSFRAMVLASALASLTSTILVILAPIREGTLPAARFLKCALRLMMAAGAAALVLATVPDLFPGDSRVHVGGELVLRALFFSMLYAAVGAGLGEVDDQDRFFLRSLGGLLRRRSA